MTNRNDVFLKPVARDDIEPFCDLMKEAFGASAPPASSPDPEMPPENEVRDYFERPEGHVMWVMEGESRVGGVVVEVGTKSGRNMLVWFFIAPDLHSHGLGTKAWYAIERQWPETRVWGLGTPYCDKRDLNFYINKCGFHVVEFFNEHHLDLATNENGLLSGRSGQQEESFWFEKNMMLLD